MSNDHIYVVIVPHADQAAQAITKVRTAHEKGAARHIPVHPGVPTGTPASTRRPPGKHAAKHASGSPTPGQASSGYVGGTHSHDRRTWSVVVDDDKYDVTDSGGACGYRIECKDTTVWLGKLSRRGTYETDSTTLAERTLKEVLRLVYVGDKRHARPRAPHAEEPKSTRRPKPKPSAAPRAEEPKSTRRSKPKPSAAAPSSETRRTEVKAKPKPSASPRTTAARPRAERTAKPATPPRAKATAKPKATSESTHAGPLTQRTPVSQPSAKPSSRRTAPRVDDTAVLNEIKKNLHEGDPSTAEKHFQVMKAIWLRGGREAAIAWKAQHKLASVVDAFDDWMEKNVEAARAMLEASPRSAPKHEHVA